MLIRIDTHNGVPIYRQVVDQIRMHILTGQVPGGEQLPSVRDLAADLRVNPMTVSKAYSLLEAENLVERRRGVGLFVNDMSRSRRTKDSLDKMESIMKHAAIIAAQLGVPADQAAAIFQKHYGECTEKTGGDDES